MGTLRNPGNRNAKPPTIRGRRTRIAPRAIVFVNNLFANGFNATKAASDAGYSPKTADKQAYLLQRHPAIAKLIAARRDELARFAGIDAERVALETKRIALSNIKEIFDEQGNLRPIHTLPDDVAASIASVEVIIKNAAAGDGKTDTIHKIKLWDKTKALDMLFRKYALYAPEEVNVNQHHVVEVRLMEARKRLAALAP